MKDDRIEEIRQRHPAGGHDTIADDGSWIVCDACDDIAYLLARLDSLLGFSASLTFNPPIPATSVRITGPCEVVCSTRDGDIDQLDVLPPEPQK